MARLEAGEHLASIFRDLDEVGRGYELHLA